MRLTASQINDYVGGQLLVEPADFAEELVGISWDSREIEQGWLYVALAGERVNGHSFVAQALKAGARGALVCEALDEDVLALVRNLGATVIQVADTYQAVTDLACGWRGHLKGRVIGLTGSTGKTTTKNLVRDVVASSMSVVATKANQNNELGVPRTLLNASADTQVIVVEMGMCGLGQIAELCAFAHPEWGLITNAGESHIGLLGSRENIARAKAELLEALPQDGLAFVNATDDYAAFMVDYARLSERDVTCVGFNGTENTWPANFNGPRVWAEDVKMDEQSRPSFTLCVANGQGEEERASCALELRGLHNVSNACSAAAVGWALGIDLATIVRALSASAPESGRQEILTTAQGVTVVNDAYNANPASMCASLTTFCALDVPGRHVAVLGDMGELGDFERECHHRVGKTAGEAGLDQLICVGELASVIAEGAAEAGMDSAKITHVKTREEALALLEGLLVEGDAVLVKASHFMRLDCIAEGLVK